MRGSPGGRQTRGGLGGIDGGDSAVSSIIAGPGISISPLSGVGDVTITATGATTAWNAIIDPTGNQALTMAAYTSTWTWNAATGASNLVTLTDTAANTGTGYLMTLASAATSTLHPFRVSVRGTTVLEVIGPHSGSVGNFGLVSIGGPMSADQNSYSVALGIQGTFGGTQGIIINKLMILSGAPSVGFGTGYWINGNPGNVVTEVSNVNSNGSVALVVGTGGLAALRANASGNVGIGVDTTYPTLGTIGSRLHSRLTDTLSATATTNLTLERNTGGGTPAANFGEQILFKLQAGGLAQASESAAAIRVVIDTPSLTEDNISFRVGLMRTGIAIPAATLEQFIVDSFGNGYFNSGGAGAFNGLGTVQAKEFRVSGSTSGYITIASPAVAGSGVTYTLPSSPTDTYLLSTNATGTLSWVAPGSVATAWNAITSATGNFSISTSTFYSQFVAQTALTNTVTYQFLFEHLTSGTAAASFGVGHRWNLENAAGTSVWAAKENVKWLTATNGAEVASYSLGLINAGSLPADGSESFIFSGAGGGRLSINNNGSNSLPVITFGDDDSGIYCPSGGGRGIGFSFNATIVTEFTNSGQDSRVIYQGPAGTASSPTYQIRTDTNTGIYSVGADDLGITTGGTLRFDVSTTAVTSTLPVLHPAGTFGAPSISLSGDTDTGFYSAAGNQLGLSCGGALTYVFGATSLQITSGCQVWADIASAAAPGYTFNTDTDTGMYRVAANVLGLSAGGTLNLSLGSNKIGFLGTAAVVQQGAGSTFTNGITAGGTPWLLTDYTSLTVYAADAATIRNNLYLLGNAVENLYACLRSATGYGLIA